MILSFFQRWQTWVALLVAATALAGCGGGGSEARSASPAANQPANGPAKPALVATIQGPARVLANTRYTYQADGADAAANGISWNWGDGAVDSTGVSAQKVWHRPGSFTVQQQVSANGETAVVRQAVAVTGAPVAANGFHTCALQTSGAVLCWGRGEFGELGSSGYYINPTPTAVNGLSDAVALAAGFNHTCALRADGTARCWGRNDYGQLGSGSTSNFVINPVSVTDLTDTVALSAGYFHTCAVQASGTVRCWGNNVNGELGIDFVSGSPTFRSTSQAVIGLTDAVAVAAGYYHSCALHAAGTVSCWGDNQYEQLDSSMLANRPTPVAVTGVTNAVALAAGGYHSCALIADGTVRCWGNNRYGQLGLRTSDEETVPVVGLSNAVALSAGENHSCALRSDGKVLCWGWNFDGQLGNNYGAGSFVPYPTFVTDLSDAVALAAGARHTCALQASAEMRCWGNNDSGQIGNGTLSNYETNRVLGGAIFWK